MSSFSSLLGFGKITQAAFLTLVCYNQYLKKPPQILSRRNFKCPPFPDCLKLESPKMCTHLQPCFLLCFDTVTISWLFYNGSPTQEERFFKQSQSSNWVWRNTDDIYHAKIKDESFYLRITYIFIPTHGFACATYFQVCQSCKTSSLPTLTVHFSWSFFCDYSFTDHLKILPHLSTIYSFPPAPLNY